MAALEKPNAFGIATNLVDRVYRKIVIDDMVCCAWDRSTGLVCHVQGEMNDTIHRWFRAMMS